MPNFIINPSSGASWDQEKTLQRLQGVADAAKNSWVQEDLNTVNSSFIGRLFWPIAKHFEWMQHTFYHIDFNQSKAILEQLKPQIASSGNLVLKITYDKAIERFNSISPKQVLPDSVPLAKPIPEPQIPKQRQEPSKPSAIGSQEEIPQPLSKHFDPVLRHRFYIAMHQFENEFGKEKYNVMMHKFENSKSREEFFSYINAISEVEISHETADKICFLYDELWQKGIVPPSNDSFSSVESNEEQEEVQDSSSYQAMVARTFPPALKKQPAYNFPAQQLTRPQLKKDSQGQIVPSLLKKRSEGKSYDHIQTFAKYKALFEENMRQRRLDLNPGLFDLHDPNFQDKALFLLGTLGKSIDALNQDKKNTPVQHLLRARAYAIGSRNDIDWNGNKITSSKEQARKQAEMESHWSSIKLFDWNAVEQDKTSQPGSYRQKVSTIATDTQSAVEMAAQKYPSEKISMIIMANAHMTGGGYQQGDTAQEEVVTTNSDAIVTLGNLAEIKGRRAVYQDGFHLPPGGNYYLKTQFVTGAKVSCNAIVHAFADFRPNARYKGNSEFEDFSKGGALDTNSREYDKRIKLDMRGVLRTAKAENQEVLILSATGCGAFGHDPVAESKAWKDVLSEPEFLNHFKEIIFAILPDPRNPRNVQAFQQIFPAR